MGSTLTAKPGTWSVAGLSYAYQWLRNGATISGATKATYKVVSADAGKSLSVRVTAAASDNTIARVVKLVEEAQFDMLVMGAYGHSRIRSLIIGSTTTAMIRACKVPVVLMR